MNQKFKKYFPPFIGILAVFAVWYIVCRAGILSSYVLPSPGRVFQSFCKMLQSGELFRDLRISFLRIGLGYSWRAIIGAEMVAASTGLGHMILFAQQMSRTDKVIVGIFAIGIAGYLTDRIFGLLISIFLKGAGENGWN